jgi:hypothetical protein
MAHNLPAERIETMRPSPVSPRDSARHYRNQVSLRSRAPAVARQPSRPQPPPLPSHSTSPQGHSPRARAEVYLWQCVTFVYWLPICTKNEPEILSYSAERPAKPLGDNGRISGLLTSPADRGSLHVSRSKTPRATRRGMPRFSTATTHAAVFDRRLQPGTLAQPANIGVTRRRSVRPSPSSSSTSHRQPDTAPTHERSP